LPFIFKQAIDNPEGNPQLRATLDGFLSFAYSANENLDTTDPDIAAKVAATLPVVVSLQMMTQAQADAIVSMGGGYRSADLTLADVQAIKAEYQRETAINNLRSQWQSLFDAGNRLIAEAQNSGGAIPTIDDLRKAQ
jgi:hypothetical protein